MQHVALVRARDQALRAAEAEPREALASGWRERVAAGVAYADSAADADLAVCDQRRHSLCVFGLTIAHRSDWASGRIHRDLPTLAKLGVEVDKGLALVARREMELRQHNAAVGRGQRDEAALRTARRGGYGCRHQARGRERARHAPIGQTMERHLSAAENLVVVALILVDAEGQRQRLNRAGVRRRDRAQALGPRRTEKRPSLHQDEEENAEHAGHYPDAAQDDGASGRTVEALEARDATAGCGDAISDGDCWHVRFGGDVVGARHAVPLRSLPLGVTGRSPLLKLRQFLFDDRRG